MGNLFALKETFYVADQELLEAFEQEATILAKLQHDAFPHVIDYFSEDERYFLLMEFIRGDNLEYLIAKRGIPFEQKQVLKWAVQLLDALKHLHSKEIDIIHRDIKPANLKLTPQDNIKLLDLGIAKVKTKGITEIATVLGATENYSPLEQIMNSEDKKWAKLLYNTHRRQSEFFIDRNSDFRTDIYALGATLYRLLTREKPVDACVRASGIWSNKSDELKPAYQANTKVSREVSDILQKAMSLYPDDRYESAEEMLKALTDFVDSSTSAMTSRNPVTIENDSDEQVTKIRAYKPKDEATKKTLKTKEADKAKPLSKKISQEDVERLRREKLPKLKDPTKPFPIKEIAYWIFLLSLLSAVAGAVYYFYFRDHSFKTLIPKNTKNLALAVFSPDGKNIIGYGLGPITYWDANGENPREVQIERNCVGYSTVLSADGKLIANGTGSTIKICDTTNGNLKQVLQDSTGIRDLAFSPDGKTIASLSVATSVRTEGELWWKKDIYEYQASTKLWNVEDGTYKSIVNKPEFLDSVTFFPDGRTIAVSSEQWDLSSGKIKRTLYAHKNPVTALSPDGKTLANAEQKDNEINLYDVDKDSLKQSFKDGSWILF